MMEKEGIQFSYASSEVDWLFSNLHPNHQVDYMREWFLHFYEDPAHNTPHDSESEYGYAFIWGGPYEADTELSARFEGVLGGWDLIQVLLDELSESCEVWAPTWDHPDHLDNKESSETDDSES